MTNIAKISAIGPIKGQPQHVLTPASEEGVRALFAGLVAIQATLEQSAPASAGIAITPSLISLLHQYCGNDPRFGLVMANVWPMQYSAMKAHSIRSDVSEFEVTQPPKTSWLSRLLGR